MAEEHRPLIEHDVIGAVDPLEGIQAIPSRVLYRWKYNQGGVACRQKARVLVQGFHEADTGDDKAAPVAYQGSIRILIANAAKRDLILRKVDSKTAFLQARMGRDARDIYAIPPKGLECQVEQANQVWRLKRVCVACVSYTVVGGVRCTRTCWRWVFTVSTASPCVYNVGKRSVLLLLYVADILLSGLNSEQVLNVIEKLKDKREAVDLGDANFLLAMGMHRNVNAGTFFWSQETCAKRALETYGMAHAHPTKTPARQGPVQINEEYCFSTEDTTLFRSATGSLVYLSRCTRPDFAHADMVLTRSMSTPVLRAITKRKRVLKYLKGALSIGLTSSGDVEDRDGLTAYVDADHAEDIDD